MLLTPPILKRLYFFKNYKFLLSYLRIKYYKILNTKKKCIKLYNPINLIEVNGLKKSIIN